MNVKMLHELAVTFSIALEEDYSDEMMFATMLDTANGDEDLVLEFLDKTAEEGSETSYED